MAAWTGNQSTAALSADAAGPAPATMNGLSAALKDASLFNDKFRNVWIFLAGPQSASAVQLESGGSSSPLSAQPQAFGLALALFHSNSMNRISTFRHEKPKCPL